MHPSESAHNDYNLHNLNKSFSGHLPLAVWSTANGQYISKSRL